MQALPESVVEMVGAVYEALMIRREREKNVF
jgi:hypothetical protein